METLIYTGIGLALLPLVMGIGYEFLMYAGKHCEKRIVRILSAPGLWMQRLTTREPTPEQLAVAIAATKHALPDVFPDFDRASYESKGGYGDVMKASEETDLTSVATDLPLTDDAPEKDVSADTVLPITSGTAPSEAPEPAETDASAEAVKESPPQVSDTHEAL